MKKYLNIVLTGDKNYVHPLGVLMVSVLENLHPDYKARFFMFVSDFSPHDEAQLNKLKRKYDCDIIYYDMANYAHVFNNIDVSTFKLQYISLATYYRLLMLDILPDDVDKCFYIDGDMIVGSDLSGIYEQCDSSTLACVVAEILAMTNKHTTLAHLKSWQEFAPLNNGQTPYFNAGFMLLNIHEAKRLNLFQAAFDFLRAHPNPPYADQDTLNAIIGQRHGDRVCFLPPQYNVFCDIDYSPEYNVSVYSQQQIKDSFSAPAVYHYAGGNKPWRTNNVKHFYDIWWHYARKSPWKNKLCRKRHKHSGTVKTYRLFNAIELIKCVSTPEKSRFLLLGVMPILTRTQKFNATYYKLFGSIPVLKIINDYHS